MATDLSFLEERHDIDTPENVVFGYEVADIGGRFVGALIDTVVLVLLLLIVNYVMVVQLRFFPAAIEAAPETESESMMSWVAGAIVALYFLIQFTIIWGYYVFFEIVWNGQSPGKRVAGTRVVLSDGSPVSAAAVVIRNLVRVIDLLPFAYAVGLVTMFANRQARRLGDFAAGTLVVRSRQEVTLRSLQPEAASGLSEATVDWLTQDSGAQPWRSYPNLERLDDKDCKLVQEVLLRHEKGALDSAVLERLTEVLATKIDHESRPQREAARAFLLQLSAACRERQR